MGQQNHHRTTGGAKQTQPVYAPPVNVLDEFFNFKLKPLQFVYIVRDGRACVASKLARSPQNLEQASSRWRFAVTVYQQLELSNEVLLVKYEDLVANPKPCLQSICEFIGVSFEASMLEGTNSSKMRKDYRQSGIIQSKGFDFD